MKKIKLKSKDGFNIEVVYKSGAVIDYGKFPTTEFIAMPDHYMELSKCLKDLSGLFSDTPPVGYGIDWYQKKILEKAEEYKSVAIYNGYRRDNP